MRLEDITRGCKLQGILPGQLINILDATWHGSEVLEIVYKDESGQPGQELLYRDSEARISIQEQGQQWNFKADGGLLRLVSEAKRIQLAYLFDPYLAVHTSLIRPLPHQISAVYGELLPRQPLRFLLADDPGAGKTIMAGLYIKELIARGDLKRCLIVCPGSLVEQWQDELMQRFHLPFEILTNDRLESAASGNAFSEIPMMIARLDKLSRDEDAQHKLSRTDWDLIVCDEAHKMSASYYGQEVKETKRRKLGRQLSRITRHFLLMTATPHNGREEDFQLFMSLLDPDRFAGRFREGVHEADVSDMMRRMVKEKMVTFDGKPLFPERRAYTVTYALSEGEAALYKEVTDYVRNEFNRADKLESGKRRGTVGFALTILQRRLASSPEAIYQSLKRRRERLERRVTEEKLEKRGAQASLEWDHDFKLIDSDFDDDLEEYTDEERLELEDEIIDQATAAKTIAELEAEIKILQQIEKQALKVRQTGEDRKWEELSGLLENQEEMFDGAGARRKIIIFTEHVDTLKYLANRIRTTLHDEDVVAVIHGAVHRDKRREIQNRFTQDIGLQILVATDAAGEGVNLQRAHLMVNYDLPWNPNRIEQRFGRIHRIGQTEVCHLWNLVADETREGEVYKTLLKKLEVASQSLGGAVFDVLGKALDGTELRKLMIEAIRYGELPEVRERLNKTIDTAFDPERLRRLIDESALVHDFMDETQMRRLRDDMERIEARRLQPHYIEAFFLEAFRHLGGTVRERESRRYEIRNVPSVIRSRDRAIGVGQRVLLRYERICFDKDIISQPGKPLAEFVFPGHSLLEAVSDIIMERYASLLKQGAVLVDETDPGEELRALVYLEHSIHDARRTKEGQRRIASRKMQFVELDAAGNIRNAGMAPYLDYRPISEEESKLISDQIQDFTKGQELEKAVTDYAIEQLVPEHIETVRKYREERIGKTLKAVKERLTKEISYWDHQANKLKEQELAGKPNARLNSGKARSRAEDLEARLQERTRELEEERQLSPQPPLVLGGTLVIPGGLLARLKGTRDEGTVAYARETKRVELLGMATVMATERRLGNEPEDVSAAKCGYDIESRDSEHGHLRFIEVKGRREDADTVTISKNEILTGLNKPDEFILALVKVPLAEGSTIGEPHKVSEALPAWGDAVPEGCRVRYLRRPFTNEPDFGVTSVNFNLVSLWESGENPA